jgi:hypothetical protein
MKASVIGAGFVIALALCTACGSGSPAGDVRPTAAPNATIPANLTLDDVYARMEQALDGGDGRVLHASVVIEDVRSPLPTPQGVESSDAEDYADQLWFHATSGVARVETRVRLEGESQDRVVRSIVRDDGTFRVDSNGVSHDVYSLTCRGSDSVLLAQLMRCANYLEKSTTRVESGQDSGASVIVLVTTGTLSDEDSTNPFTMRLYVDLSTYLPTASELETESDTGTTQGSYRVRSRYDVEYVERSSLAADFFDPASIGWVEADPTARLRADVGGMRVYWLGSEVDLGTGGPTLSLFLGGIQPGGTGPGYRATLSYEEQGGRRNYPVLNLQEYPLDAWNALAPSEEIDPEDIQLPDGRAVLFRIPASYDRYVAQVYFDTTVILVVDSDQPSSISDRDSMLAVIKALRPYE